MRRALTTTTVMGTCCAVGVAAASADPTATAQAVASPPAVGTLSTLTYTFPAGSGGALLAPLGISAFQGKVYVSNTAANVLSVLDGDTTTTVAGSTSGYGESGDGGPATEATLNQPTGTAEDAAGNVYVADSSDNVIRKINVKSGIITRIAGTGVAGKQSRGGSALRSQLNAPQDVAVDRSGNVYVADTVNNRVVEVTRGGQLRIVAGDGQAGFRGDGGRATRAELTEPTGVALDVAGNLYVADAGNNVIRRVDARSGNISTVAGNYAAGEANNGLGGFSGDGGPATQARLNVPQGVALDSAGDLFIADTFNNAIREVTPDGTIFTVVNQAGADGAAPVAGAETAGPATASLLKGPSAVAVDDSTSTVYVADTSNSKAAAVTGLARSGKTPGPVAPQHRG